MFILILDSVEDFHTVEERRLHRIFGGLTISVSGKTYTISITGRFTTMLVGSRQVFDGIDSITSSTSGDGTWTQTGYTSSLLDQRRTYSITVSGTFRIASATFANKLASADFYCGTTGVVS